MAVDTRNRRFSMLGFAQAHGAPVVFPNPDNDIDTLEDRSHFAYLYPGISIQSGQPTIRRYGGVPHMRNNTPVFGRSW